MKFLGTILLFLCGLLVLSGSAVAYKISDSDVGDLDKVVATASLGNSGDAAELAWIKSVLGDDYTINSKYDVDDSNWTQTDTSSVYALGLNGSPGYFFIKLGTGNTSIASHWLYQNFENLYHFSLKKKK
jgi:hypothetical protein